MTLLSAEVAEKGLGVLCSDVVAVSVVLVLAEVYHVVQGVVRISHSRAVAVKVVAVVVHSV